MDVEVSDTGSYLTLNHSFGSYRFHAIWLRDNALDDEGKIPGMVTPPFPLFAPIIQNILSGWYPANETQ